MQKVYLLRSSLITGSSIELDGARLDRVLRADATKVEVDGAIEALNLVLDEQANFDMAILEELVHLLTDDAPIVCVHFGAHLDESSLCIANILSGVSTFDELLECIQVLHREVVDFFWLHGQLNLVLDAHNHQVEQLLHTRIIQLHDRAVRKLLEDLLRRVHRVQILRPEQFIDETPCEQAFHDVLQDFGRAVFGDVLRPQTLVKDVNHLTAEI